MEENSPEFTKAAEDVKSMTKKPNDSELVQLYSFYKQALVGDIIIARPGMLDFKGKAKWDGWKSKEGIPKEEAEKQYIALAKAMLKKYGAG